MAFPTYVAAGAASDLLGAITPALPAGILTDDVLLLFIETANQAITIPTPNGGTWTQVTNSPQGTGGGGGADATRLTIFWSRYNGTQGAPTTSDSGDHQLGVIHAFRDCKTTGNPFNISSGNFDGGDNTAVSVTGATTTVADCLVVVAATSTRETGTENFGATWTNADLASITTRGTHAGTAGNDGLMVVVTGTKATAGAYAATTNTMATGSENGMMTVALEPSAITGTGALVSGATDVTGAGASSSTGTGALVSGAADVTGVGSVTWVATGALVSGATDVTGAGLATWEATGALLAGVEEGDAPEVAGAGLSASSGTGALVSVAAQIVGSGEALAMAQGGIRVILPLLRRRWRWRKKRRFL
jgi:hypothetical protein